MEIVVASPKASDELEERIILFCIKIVLLLCLIIIFDVSDQLNTPQISTNQLLSASASDISPMINSKEQTLGLGTAQENLVNKIY